jgi:hypothetical protein
MSFETIECGYGTCIYSKRSMDVDEWMWKLFSRRTKRKRGSYGHYAVEQITCLLERRRTKPLSESSLLLVRDGQSDFIDAVATTLLLSRTGPRAVLKPKEERSEGQDAREAEQRERPNVDEWRGSECESGRTQCTICRHRYAIGPAFGFHIL